MSQDIKPGDQVMVVRGMPCCGFLDPFKYGQVFTVTAIGIIESGCGCRCRGCGRSVSWLPYASLGIFDAAFHMLKKIDPISEDEHTNTDEQIKEPA